MAEVFISYSKRARQFTGPLATSMEREKLSVWWDRELSSGESFRHEIRRQLSAAQAVVVIWSRAALDSNWVYAEAAVAARAGRLVSVIAEDVKPEELPLPFGEVFHLVRIEDEEEILRAVRNRIEGRLEPARDKKFDERWSGFWLLDPQQAPFDAADANPSPASLLLARHALVPFLELEDELTEFLQWATGAGNGPEQGRKTVCARVLDGAGGLGKTRLMIEVCARLSDEGWLSGFVAENLIGKGFETSESRLRSLIEEGNGARPLFLVVDYAETRRADVEWICKRLLRRRDKRGTAARLVLVSRAAGEWWTELFGDPDIQKLFGRDNGEADVISLERLSAALTAEKRRELFDSSIHSLGTVLREAGRPMPIGPPTQTQLERVDSSPDNARPLAIQLEALLHLYGEAPSEGRLGIDVLLDRVLGLETSSWPRRLKIQEHRERRLRVARAVSQTTLAKNVESKERAIALFKMSERCSDDVADSMHHELHMLYGKQSGGLWPLEPDLIGEHHVAGTSDQGMVDACLDWAGDDPLRRRDILTVLNRATREEHGPVGGKALEHLRRLIGNPRFEKDLEAISIGTPGRLLRLLTESREARSAPILESAQQSARPERHTGTSIPVGTIASEGGAIAATELGARTSHLPSSTAPDKADYFISRSGSDRDIAQKIAQILEEGGARVFVQDWNFSSSTFMEALSHALMSGARVIALLSPSYLASDFCMAESNSVLGDDPLNRQGRLVPLRIAPCEPKGLLRALAYWDLVPVLSSDAVFAETVRKAVGRSNGREGQASELPVVAASQQSKAVLHPQIRAQHEFVARDEQLLAIDSSLWSSNAGDTTAAVVTAVTGMGGTGKSALAREYAWQARDGYAGIWWLNAEGETTLIDGLIELGGTYMPNLERMSDRSQAAHKVLDFLAHGGFDKPWLLIYDNLSDRSLLSQWSPVNPVRLLVTTRSASWGDSAKTIEVGPWTVEQSVAFLQKVSHRSDDERGELVALARELGCLPLALSHAASYLAGRPQLSVNNYRSSLGDALHRRSMPSSRAASYPDSVFATFKAAIGQAMERSPGSEIILWIAAFLGSDEIPAFLFDIVAEGGSVPNPVAALDKVKRREAFATLKALSLISMSEDQRSFAVHRLVQLAVRDDLGDTAAEWANRTAAILNAAFPRNYSLETWPTCSLLGRHSSVLSGLIGANGDMQDVAVALGDAAEAMNGQVSSGDVQASLEAALSILTRQMELDAGNERVRDQFAVASGRLADALIGQGNPNRAVEVLQVGLVVQERLAQRAPVDARVQGDLANLLEKVGDVSVALADLGRAQDAYTRSLEIRQRLSEMAPPGGKWQREHCRSLEKLGDVFVSQGSLERALEAYQRSRVIGDELAQAYPDNSGIQRDLSITYDRIADVLRDKGELPAALHAISASLTITERLIEVAPRNTGLQRDLAVTRDRLGDVVRMQGNLDSALRFYQQSLAVKERLSRADPANAGWQRDLAVSLNKVGDVLAAQGTLVDAMSRFRAAVAITERLAQADPGNAGWQRDLSVSKARIGDTLVAQGDLQESLTNFQASLAITEGLARADPGNAGWARDLAIAHNRIGDVYQSMGQLLEADRSFRAALGIVERLAATDPDNTAWLRIPVKADSVCVSRRTALR